MSDCDGCGRPIGHAEEITVEYHSEELDETHHVFGSEECKRIFENDHDVESKTECDHCGELVKKSWLNKSRKDVSGIPCTVYYHPECQKKVVEENQQLDDTGDTE